MLKKVVGMIKFELTSDPSRSFFGNSVLAPIKKSKNLSFSISLGNHFLRSK